VRGYLRHRLFTAVHNSRLGLRHLDTHPVSPKLHTLNLLIAEYLLKQRHHFTLSVFSCEAPNVSCISPNVPEMLKTRSSGHESVHVFGSQDLDDIVETLGLPKDSEMTRVLRNSYEEGKHNALITCILRSLPQFFEKQSEPPKVEQKQDTQAQTDDARDSGRLVFM